jgi:hypothetical protein
MRNLKKRPDKCQKPLQPVKRGEMEFHLRCQLPKGHNGVCSDTADTVGILLGAIKGINYRKFESI